MERQQNSHANAAAITISTTTTVIPRQGACGIGRSYSRGGPPCTRSISGGLLKNNRGRRRMRLKLEVDEGIAASLSENNRTGHKGPYRCDNPARQTHYGGFDIAIAQRPMHENHPGGDERDLQHFTRSKNCVAVRVSAKHAAQHSRGNREIRCSKKYPRDANGSVSGEPGEESSGEIARPLFVLKETANNTFDDEVRAMKQAPNDKRPGRTVPETTEKHYYDEIGRAADRTDLVAAEWNVKVVPQKCGK